MDGKRLKYYRLQMGLSQRALAKEASAYLRHKEKITGGRIGQIEIQDWVSVGDEMCFALAKALKISASELMGEPPGADKESLVYLIPIKGKVPRPVGTKVQENAGEGYLEVPVSQLPGSQEKDLFTVKAAGSSLASDGIQDGMWIIADRRAPVKDGDICILQTGGQILASHVSRSKGKVRLIAANRSQELPSKDVEILGKAVLWGSWSRPPWPVDIVEDSFPSYRGRAAESM